MKRTLTLFLTVLCLACGCDRGDSCVSCTEPPVPRRLQLTLLRSVPETKGSDALQTLESQVSQCLLYVFSRSGHLVNCYQSSDGRFDFFLTDETYDFVAVANKASLPLSGIGKADLFRTETTLADNGAGGFVMVGRLDSHLIEADEKITVEMERLVAKVSYEIHTAFSGPLADASFQVDAVYLTNVVGGSNLALTDSLPAAQALWYNRMDREDRADAPLALLEGGPVFYAYPNASPDNHDKTQWGSRCTRFVVKATLASRTTYYPVTIPRVRANHHYHIDLTIANFGVDHPEDLPQDYNGFQARLHVVPWTSGASLQGNF